MGAKKGGEITRREFARRAALVSAASLVPPGKFAVHSEPASPVTQQPADLAKLSPESAAEADARYQAILGSYGSRFSDAQKVDLRRLCYSAQPSLDRVRAYAIENSDAPAVYLKPLVEREKKSETASPSRSATTAQKKP